MQRQKPVCPISKTLRTDQHSPTTEGYMDCSSKDHHWKNKLLQSLSQSSGTTWLSNMCAQLLTPFCLQTGIFGHKEIFVHFEFSGFCKISKHWTAFTILVTAARLNLCNWWTFSCHPVNWHKMYLLQHCVSFVLTNITNLQTLVQHFFICQNALWTDEK